MLKVYGDYNSGNCYKVELLLTQLVLCPMNNLNKYCPPATLVKEPSTGVYPCRLADPLSPWCSPPCSTKS
jgi:hypothetical protein